ncbi:transmembrane protein 170A isoform X2 [Harpegnathos saltator]|uniref:transmembrane protein 170A isoform X2 n=1 Tax=Harpegnathos saltator TaxID=610380 RepID=UPI000DBED4B5|nr:transmembrane protein 170A isoform X2 [Harpegnathos saltator]
MALRNMNSGNIFYMPLTSFAEMWYQIFLWALFSSIFVHTIAGAICFATLRQHKYGKYILSTAYYNNGCAVAIDIRSRQFSGSCFCI